MTKSEAFKRVISEVKYSHHLKQSEIADRLNIKAPYLSDMINGRVPISKNITDKIYEFFHINIDNVPQATPSESQASADSVSMPRDVWEVIRDQAASLKAKDEQVNELIGILRKEVSKKGEGVGAINPVARQAAGE